MVRPSLVVMFVAAVSASLVAAGGVGQTTAPKPQAPKPAPAKPAPAKPTTPAPKAATPAAAPAPAPAPPKPATDVRLKTALTQGAQVSENVMYLQGPRQRVEFPGMVALDQCDLRRSVMLNPEAKKYRVQPYAEAVAAPAPAPEPPTVGPTGPMGQGAPRGGVVTITTTLTDTLERQTMFGMQARRVKSLLIKDSSPKACDKTGLKVEVDAWYIDLPEQSSCARPAAQPPPKPAADPGACTDQTETRTVGDVKLGFPVKVTTTTTVGDGDKAEVTTSSQEVTELEVTRLDKALFEVPGDYAEASSSAEIVPALAKGGGLSDALFGNTADGTSTATPKKSGVIRIGVLEPINHSGRELSTTWLRQDVVSKFNKAPYEALPLRGSSPAEVEADAKRLECDYILLTDITEVKTSKPGGIGSTLKKVSGSADKDKHEVKLDYKLFPAGATQTAKVAGKSSASSGGFGVGSALRLAAFAGQMYFSVMGMGGLMNPMMGMGQMGMMGGSLFDPRASMMTTVAQGFMGGGAGSMAGMAGGAGGDQSDQDMRETVTDALGNAAKATMEQLSKPTKKG